MTIRQVSAKIDLRLNKSASGDYDNIWPYAKQEAFNKAINDWIRRQKRGTNINNDGAEETDLRVDDLQILLKKERLISYRRKKFNETVKLPKDYLYFKRLTPTVSHGRCSEIEIQSYFREEANVDSLSILPSFEFEETYHTMIGNKFHIYHESKFDITGVTLTYYRKPKFYDFTKLDQEVEFKDDICEILVDEACKIIASDIESLNQKNLAQERAENNN